MGAGEQVGARRASAVKTRVVQTVVDVDEEREKKLKEERCLASLICHLGSLA